MHTNDIFDKSELFVLYAYETMLSIEHGDIRVHNPFSITVLTEPVFHAQRSLELARCTVSVSDMLAYPVRWSIEIPNVAIDMPVMIIADVSTDAQIQTIWCVTAMRKLPTSHIEKLRPWYTLLEMAPSNTLKTEMMNPFAVAKQRNIEAWSPGRITCYPTGSTSSTQ